MGMAKPSGLRITDRHVFFWGGWPSQWHKADFVIDGVRYGCCEQFMMAEKARVFGDRDAEREILGEANPRKQKALGRGVRGFDSERWNEVCRGVVYTANLAKFGQNDDLRELLLGTGERVIVEASPSDTIWGIGLHQDDPLADDERNWKGTNWLGVALVQVRTALRAESSGVAAPLDVELARQLAARKR